MQTKSLLYGLIGFFIGGLLVSVAATTFDKPAQEKDANTSMSSISMLEMSSMLEGKTGDDYDRSFIEGMIAHHEGAVAMAKQSAASAKHAEIKKLSEGIISAQEKEIAEMKQWQAVWGYGTRPMEDMGH
jgi:uncharacterized protein (DUF305 family)